MDDKAEIRQTGVPYKGSKPYIFISYAHKDKACILPILAAMQRDGYRIWFDEGIDPGTEWDQSIAEHIRNCGFFLAFISANYLCSDNCKDELNYARDLNKQRVMVYLEDTHLPPGMAMRMNRLQAIHYYSYSSQDEFLKKLYETDQIVTFCDDPARRDAFPVPMPEPEPSASRLPKWVIPAGIGVAAIVLVALLVIVLLHKPSDDGGSDTDTQTYYTQNSTTSRQETTTMKNSSDPVSEKTQFIMPDNLITRDDKGAWLINTLGRFYDLNKLIRIDDDPDSIQFAFDDFTNSERPARPQYMSEGFYVDGVQFKFYMTGAEIEQSGWSVKSATIDDAVEPGDSVLVTYEKYGKQVSLRMTNYTDGNLTDPKQLNVSGVDPGLYYDAEKDANIKLFFVGNTLESIRGLSYLSSVEDVIDVMRGEPDALISYLDDAWLYLQYTIQHTSIRVNVEFSFDMNSGKMITMEANIS